MRGIEDIEELEAIKGEAALRWVRKQNAHTRKALDHTATFRKLNKECRLSKRKNKSIDDIWLGENELYQRVLFDNQHPKGLLQEIEKESFCSDNPQWKTLLDIDSYLKQEQGEFKFSAVINEKFGKKIVSLMTFSEAGSDAVIVREFNIKTKKFIENGFSLPKARHDITWYSPNHLLLATDCGVRSSTDSNYPRSIRLLKRSSPLAAAEILFEIDPSHMMANSSQFGHGKRKYLFFIDHIDFYHATFYLVSKKNIKNVNPLPIPSDAEFLDVYQDTALIKLNSNWQIDEETILKENTLIGMDLKKFRNNPRAPAKELNIRVWYEANNHSKIDTVFCNEDNVYLFIVNNLRMQILHMIPSASSIRTRYIPISADYSNISPLFIDTNNEMFFHFETFLQPKMLYAYNPATASLRLLQQGSAYFDASRYFVRRLETTSKDGTIVPYHIVASRNLKQDGLNPTILNGYGGFDDYLNPTYLKLKSIALLEKGFIYVHAHIRGGGEFGPQWHSMGSGEHKQNSFDDFIAVAENLIQLNITSSRYLGIEGASNGGLLVAACVTQRPELFNAIFCDVAVLDMQRYHQLFIGRSWVAEYGNPDDFYMRQILAAYSPLHNINATKTHPTIFIQSSKTDDRVHPYHARAMTYQLQAAKNPTLYFEKKDGGHTGVSFEECIRVYTYWHLRLLLPAQQARKRDREESSENNARFFNPTARHASRRRLELSLNNLM